MSQKTLEEQATAECIFAIIESLKKLGYNDPHLTIYQNPNNGAAVILTGSPDQNHSFAIEVYRWGPKSENQSEIHIH